MRAALLTLLAVSVAAQRTTFVDEGDTVAAIITTDADGDPSTRTLSTISTFGATPSLTTPALTTTDELTTTASTTTSRRRPVVTTTAATTTSDDTTDATTTEATVTEDAGAAETTGHKEEQKGNVGKPTENDGPVTVSTYGINRGDGWESFVWHNSFTAPTVATAVPSAGSIMNYQQYMSSQNAAATERLSQNGTRGSSASALAPRFASAAAAAALAAMLV